MTTAPKQESPRYYANALRALSMDMVQQALSGHPGMPMGMADIAERLWRTYLRHDPNTPTWWDRDRFILSNGHGAALHYALLHLSGYDLPLHELRRFRQWESKTPGHPEIDPTIGVEVTTGPLGQGIANGVGMALAECLLATRYNRDNCTLFNHYTYVFAGDGCMMEGISHEACSLAGTLALSKLIVFYDDNGISIDGEVSGWYTDNIAERFSAYGWQVIECIDGHDSAAITDTIDAARSETERPTLIICHTIIGYGAPHKQGTAATHGAPLGEEEVAAARENLGWHHAPFEVPADIYQKWDARAQGEQLHSRWQEKWMAYQRDYPDLSHELVRRMHGELPQDLPSEYQKFIADCQRTNSDMATRKASKICITHLSAALPELIGGSADLSDSNNTICPTSQPISAAHYNGNYIYYGVREFAMTAMMSGLSLHGGFIPYGGTFLVFMEYAVNAVRMAALMHQRCILIYSHDSIGLGEDGATHQPVEHLTLLRSIPNLALWRPADLTETAVAWGEALKNHDGPTALILTRQTTPHIQRSAHQISLIDKGGYIVREARDGQIDLIIIATGSEVHLAQDVAQQLEENDSSVGVRVVSMPSTDRFATQPAEYREKVLPNALRCRLAIESAHGDYWRKWVGLDGEVCGLHDYGASAPGTELMRQFGFSVESVLPVGRAVLERHSKHSKQGNNPS